ncbi:MULTISPECIES: hypothetical protein [unclassified Frigoribacterium]|uniref:hypothetical protein n=1 Tax=unclassified Frigoribacterium TaxID=2627005 RepID=UPI0006F66134|nr:MULTISPECIES: hypothetical protein [unclassified Frigoribacterium]KQO45403.1 hypothetical protein ASF07_14775 [Frigoribacterium sp. Leaf254]KQT37105.1 hypothetical protein ASG28_15570 [Frigoribacterium sp. Leaf415]
MTNAPDDQQRPEPVLEPSVERPAESIVERDEVTVRRAPKVPVFLIMGAALGVVVSLIVTSLFPFDSGEGVAQTYGYISLWGLTIGGAVGCVVAIIAERVTSRGAKRVQVERERLEVPVDEADAPPRQVTDGDSDRV